MSTMFLEYWFLLSIKMIFYRAETLTLVTVLPLTDRYIDVRFYC